MNRYSGRIHQRLGCGPGPALPSSAWRCPACGKGNIASARFCGGCGRLTTLSATIMNPRPLRPADRATTADHPETGVRSGPVPIDVSANDSSPLRIQMFAPAEPKARPRSAERTRAPEGPLFNSPANLWAESGAGQEAAFPSQWGNDTTPEPVPASSGQTDNAASSGWNDNAALAGRTGLFWHRLRSGCREWFGPRLGMAVLFGGGLTGLVVVTLVLSGFRGLATPGNLEEHRERTHVVSWGELKPWMGQRLGLSPEEMDRLSHKAIGLVPEPGRSMTRSQVQRLAAWTRRQVPAAEEIVPDLEGEGFLLKGDLAGQGPRDLKPFRDLPFDHPVYSAWKGLLDLDLGKILADGEGRARPSDAIRWEEWSEVKRRIESRFSGPTDSGLAGHGAGLSGEMTLPALISALEEMARHPALQDGAGGEYGAIRPLSNRRFEAFSALSVLVRPPDRRQASLEDSGRNARDGDSGSSVANR